MYTIIRGTTPTIVYTFDTVSVLDISVAYLTISNKCNVCIEKSISEAIIGDNSVSWVLTQEETLGMDADTMTAMVNWKLIDGTRGVSPKVQFVVAKNSKEEVI